jgi:hypothetical protein
MSTACLSLESLAGWVERGIAADEEERIEQHLFECDRCTARAEGLERVVRQLRAMLPPVLTPERRRHVEAMVRPLPIVPVSSGERAAIEFPPGTEVGFWLIRADLTGVQRLDCALYSPDGSALGVLEDVPFDPERGEMVLACQRLYRDLGYPADMVVRVSSVSAVGARPLGEYFLKHVFHGV